MVPSEASISGREVISTLIQEIQYKNSTKQAGGFLPRIISPHKIKHFVES